MTEAEVIGAFHAMWDNFPESVMLIKKSREIFGVNKKAASLGLKEGVGMKCSQIGSPENHKGCMCNEAADEKKAVYIQYQTKFGRALGYWIPVAGAEEYLIHFGAGGTFEYPDTGVKR